MLFLPSHGSQKSEHREEMPMRDIPSRGATPVTPPPPRRPHFVTELSAAAMSGLLH